MLLLLLLNREACISSREVSSCQPLLVRLAEAARRPPLGGLLRQLGYEDWQVCWL